MKTQPKTKISSLLKEAYHWLGIRDVPTLERRTREALAYLDADREHYIQVADKDTPEYMISTKHGCICKLIPLAEGRSRERRGDSLWVETRTVFLMVAQGRICYIDSKGRTKYGKTKENTSYTFPVYRYITLTELPQTLQVCAPQDIRPIASKLDWKAYTMAFAVFEKIDKSGILNRIPYCTEQAMFVCRHTEPEAVTIKGEVYSGKLVTLAWEQPLWADLMEDHRYHFRKELCLLVTAEAAYYVLKTRHVYEYFRKRKIADAPGGCVYEPTESKQETTYDFVTLEEISRDLSSAYH